MKKRARIAAATLSGMPFLATTTAAAIGEPTTGIVSLGPASVLISIALGLVLTLIARPLVGNLSHSIERQLAERRLLRRLDAAGMGAIHQFILPGNSGGLVPIDHAVRVPGGVVCIQTKHYKGTVFSSHDGAQWSSVDGETRRRFMNPAIQNESRVQAVRKAVPELPVASLVVFTGAVQFPDARPAHVVTIDELPAALDNMAFDPQAVAAVEDWEATWLKLKAAALTDEGSRKDLAAQVSFG